MMPLMEEPEAPTDALGHCDNAMRVAVKREAGLEFLPQQYHGVFAGLTSEDATDELQRLRDYFLTRTEVRPVVAGGGSRSGARRRRRTGVYKCFLERHVRYAALHATCRRLEEDGKLTALLVLLRLVERTIVEPSAGGLLPWEKPRLVPMDLSGAVEDLTGEEEQEQKQPEQVVAAADDDVDQLAVDVEAYCAAHGLDSISSDIGGGAVVRVKKEPL